MRWAVGGCTGFNCWWGVAASAGVSVKGCALVFVSRPPPTFCCTHTAMNDSAAVSTPPQPPLHNRHQSQNKNSPEGLVGLQRRYVQFGGGCSDQQLEWLDQQLQVRRVHMLCVSGQSSEWLPAPPGAAGWIVCTLIRGGSAVLIKQCAPGPATTPWRAVLCSDVTLATLVTTTTIMPLQSTHQEAEQQEQCVIVSSHLPIYPDTCPPACLVWNYDQVLDILQVCFVRFVLIMHPILN